MRISTMCCHIVQCLKQHTPGSTCRVVNSITSFRGKDLDHQGYDRARGVEFPGLFIGQVCKFLDQIFVRLSKYVSLAAFIAKAQSRKVLDKVF